MFVRGCKEAKVSKNLSCQGLFVEEAERRFPYNSACSLQEPLGCQVLERELKAFLLFRHCPLTKTCTCAYTNYLYGQVRSEGEEEKFFRLGFKGEWRFKETGKGLNLMLCYSNRDLSGL